MQKITTHLWYDKEAKEAADFYTSVFPDSRIQHASVLQDTPSGTVDLVNVDLAGSEFTLLSAGPLFKFNPSVSFIVACDTTAEADRYWKALNAGGTTMMEMGAYPFSERFGWTSDRYGLSWQIMFVGDRPIRRKITPMLMFTGPVAGKAEEAMKFYTSVFRNASIDNVLRHPGGAGPDKAGSVQHASFRLEGQQFSAMDSAYEHDFNFNEAISLMVHCKDQAEIDYYWEKLSAVPESEQCGWLKDKYGLSWQIVPTAMDRLMQSDDKAAVARVTEAFLKMKKFDIAALERAAAGRG